MKLALGVEYVGTKFHGWQLQTQDIRTVQQVVERALSIVANCPIRVFCSGRTDTGVHAIEQTIHFVTNVERPTTAWLCGGNVNLPDDVSFTWVKIVNDDFHARFSAIARQYKYYIHNSPTPSALIHHTSLWEPRKINVDAMLAASNYLLGEHDFSAFRSSICQAKSAIKTIEYIRINKQQQQIIIDIKANAFLHNMVRNIVGTLLMVGMGKQPPNWIQTVLDSKQRKQAGVKSTARGLYFVKAFYNNY